MLFERWAFNSPPKVRSKLLLRVGATGLPVREIVAVSRRGAFAFVHRRLSSVFRTWTYRRERRLSICHSLEPNLSSSLDWLKAVLRDTAGSRYAHAASLAARDDNSTGRPANYSRTCAAVTAPRRSCAPPWPRHDNAQRKCLWWISLIFKRRATVAGHGALGKRVSLSNRAWLVTIAHLNLTLFLFCKFIDRIGKEFWLWLRCVNFCFENHEKFYWIVAYQRPLQCFFFNFA